VRLAPGFARQRIFLRDEGSADGIPVEMPSGLLRNFGSGRLSGLSGRPANCADEVTDHRKDDEEYDDPGEEAHKKTKGGAPAGHPRSLLDYFFRVVPFFDCGASGFAYCVLTCPVMDASMLLADSAFGPVGASSRYFWNASAVPSTGVTFPSGVI
jgi:hypothetical protein